MPSAGGIEPGFFLPGDNGTGDSPAPAFTTIGFMVFGSGPHDLSTPGRQDVNKT